MVKKVGRPKATAKLVPIRIMVPAEINEKLEVMAMQESRLKANMVKVLLIEALENRATAKP